MRTLAGFFLFVGFFSTLAVSAEPAKMRAKPRSAEKPRLKATARPAKNSDPSDEFCETAQRSPQKFNSSKLGGDLGRRMQTLIDYEGRPDVLRTERGTRSARFEPATRRINFSWATHFGVVLRYNDGSAPAGGIVSLRKIAELSLRPDVESIFARDGESLREVILHNARREL